MQILFSIVGDFYLLIIGREPWTGVLRARFKMRASFLSHFFKSFSEDKIRVIP